MHLDLLCYLLLLPLHFIFPNGTNGWEGDFTDYPEHQEKFYELKWGWGALPTSISNDRGVTLKNGLYLSGNNHSDDLFMFIRRKVGGLQPNTTYRVQFAVLLETDVPKSSIGIGGAPGESLFFKAGAATRKPIKVLQDGFYHLSVDKGDQSQGGKNAEVIGDLAHPEVLPDAPAFLPKRLCSKEGVLVRTNGQGELWIFVGTDSGFEGRTLFYIAEVAVDFLPFAQD